eukprot:scaffold13194_cov26-Prasinocladus_malaysianus.AAC.1
MHDIYQPIRHSSTEEATQRCNHTGPRMSSSEVVMHGCQISHCSWALFTSSAKVFWKESEFFL